MKILFTLYIVHQTHCRGVNEAAFAQLQPKTFTGNMPLFLQRSIMKCTGKRNEHFQAVQSLCSDKCSVHCSGDCSGSCGVSQGSDCVLSFLRAGSAGKEKVIQNFWSNMTGRGLPRLSTTQLYCGNGFSLVQFAPQSRILYFYNFDY